MDQQMNKADPEEKVTTFKASILALALAGIVLIIFSARGISPRQARAGGRPMNNSLRGTILHTSKTLLGLASARRGDKTYLISIEHLYQASKTLPNVPTEKTLWHFWNCNQQDQTFHQSLESTLGIPSASALSTAFEKDSLIGLVENNQEHGAFMLSWKAANSQAERFPEMSSNALPLDLSPEMAQQVRLEVTELWSTRNLQPTEWLFNPSLAVLPDNTAVAVMNTADAHAAVWKLRDLEASKEAWALLPNVLEPVPISLGSTLALFHRIPTPKWSVYFHAPRYSGAYGPLLLPLAMLELGQEGKVLRRVNLSQEQAIGEVFSLAVASDQNRLALVTVSGSKEMPVLHTYFSHDLGKTFHEIGASPLSAVPSQLSLGLGATEAVVGLAYKEPPAYLIEGFCIPL